MFPFRPPPLPLRAPLGPGRAAPRPGRRQGAGRGAVVRALLALGFAAAFDSAPAAAQVVVDFNVTLDGGDPIPNGGIVINEGEAVTVDFSLSIDSFYPSSVKLWLDGQGEAVDRRTCGTGTKLGLSAANPRDNVFEMRFNESLRNGVPWGTYVWRTGQGDSRNPESITILGCEDDADSAHEVLDLVFDGVLCDGREASQRGDYCNTTETLRITVIDNDVPDLSVRAPAPVEEGASGERTALDFTAALATSSLGGVTVDWDVGGTAENGVDYEPLATGTLSFATGTMSQTISVTVTGDDAVEPNETVVVTLSDPEGARIATGTATGIILNDDQYALSIDSPDDVDEGALGATTPLEFTVRLDQEPQQEVTVGWDVGGTAENGVDYEPLATGTLTFAAGTDSLTIPVTVTGDNAVELDETVVLTLSDPSGIVRITGTGSFTIRNDDFPALSIDSPGDVDEGASAATTSLVFTVTLSTPPPWAVAVDWDVGGTAENGIDYEPLATGTLSFATGTVSRTIQVTVTGDDAIELDETVVVTISNPDPMEAAITTGVGTGRIVNDDLPALSIDDPSVEEGASGATTSLTFRVTLDQEPLERVTVDYDYSVDGTASAGGDYTAPAPGTLAFEVGETLKTITVGVVDDDDMEESETVVITLSNEAGAVIAKGTGTGTILDDDVPVLSIGGASLNELSGRDSGNSAKIASSSLQFPMRLSETTSLAVKYSYRVVGGTATRKDSANRMDGDDYEFTTENPRTWSQPNRFTEENLEFKVFGDSDVEPDETIIVEIFDVENARLVDGENNRIATTTATGVIVDDDTAFSVVPPSVVEGAGGATTSLAFTVTLSRSLSQEASLDYRVAPESTATGGEDYEALPAGTLAFPAGETSGTVAVVVNDDDRFEGDETVVIEFLNPNRIGLSERHVTGTILDDDLPRFSIDSPDVLEGATGTTTALDFTVELPGAFSGNAAVDYAVTGGTAVAGDDYAELAGGRLTFATGTTSRTISVAVAGDDTVEPDETVVVELSNPSANTVIGTGTGTGTIRNDDRPVASIDSPSVSEGATGTTALVFTVRLDQPSHQAVTVDWSTADGTATAGNDYEAATGTLEIAPRATEGTITVEVIGDDLHEPDRTMTVALSNPTGDADIGTGTGTGTITDDDPLTLSVPPVSVPEGGEGMTAQLVFEVRLASRSPNEVTVEYSVGDGTATSSDYTAPADGTLRFAPNERLKTVTVEVEGDDDIEGDETVVITLSNPMGAGFEGGADTLTGVGTIVADEAPAFRIGSAGVGEGEGLPLLFTVTLSPPSGQEVTVDYAVGAAGTAESGTDYTPPSGSELTFARGITSATIEIAVIEDGLVEPDETVVIELSNPTGDATFAGNAAVITGTGVIRDDDEPRISIAAPAAVAEGAMGATTSLVFPVTLDQEAVRPVTVDYRATGGSAESDDYTLAPGTLRFAAGVDRQEIRVTVLGDDRDEDNETVEVTLSNPNPPGAVIAAGTATGRITDDDVPEFAILPASADEGDSATTSLVFTVTVDPPSFRPLTVGYTVADGTAEAGADYLTPAGSFGVAAGATSSTITIEVRGDGVVEDDETLTVTLSEPPGEAEVRSGGGTATGTINNDDHPSVSIDPMASVAEGATGTTALVFTARLDRPSNRTVTVEWSTADGTATAGEDYAAANGTITFVADDLVETFEVAVNGDNLAEPNETLTVALSGPTGGVEIGTATVTGTITDDDPLTLSIDSLTVNEGDMGTTNHAFTVRLASRSSGEVTVDYAVTGVTATAGTDYQASAGGTLTFMAHDTEETIPITVEGDGVDEDNERVEASLSNPTGATIETGRGTGTLTITDDDVPGLAILPASVAEGDSATTSLVFTVTVDPPSFRPLTVGYTVAEGTAEAGVDYLAPAGSFDVAAGATSSAITIEVQGDGVVEDDETLTVTLLEPPGEAVVRTGGGTATGTIGNDDHPSVSIDPMASVAEGATGTTALVFTARLDRPSNRTVTVEWSTADGTATAGEDYAAANGTLRFIVGDLVETFEVAVNGDNLAEPDETLTVELSGPTAGLEIGTAMVTGTISDDDPLELSINDPSVPEGAAGMTAQLVFEVRLASRSMNTVTVAYGVTGGTAISSGPDADYTALADGTLTFDPDDLLKTITVMVQGDDDIEGDETVEITLSSPTGGAAIARGIGTGTIAADEAPAFRIGSAEVDEGSGSPLRFTVTLSPPAGARATVDYAVSGGTATDGADYTAPPAGSSLTFETGDTSRTIEIAILDDDRVEPDETVEITLSNANGGGSTVQRNTGTGTILDDDLPELSISSPTLPEEGAAGDMTPLVFTVTLDQSPLEPVTVGYGVTGGSAISGEDYVPLPGGTLRFATGTISRTITLTVRGDGAAEENETVRITLSNPMGATIAPDGRIGEGTITDDDEPGLSINSPSVDEGASGTTTPLVFEVRVDPPSFQELTVGYTVEDIGATAGVDYRTPSGTLTIPARTQLSRIVLEVIGDDDAEPDEQVRVRLSDPPGAAIRTGEGTGTIRNDDVPMFAVDPPAPADEGTEDLVFAVTLDPPSYRTVEVDWSTADGTATAGEDYVGGNGTLTFAAGERRKTVTVAVNGDNLHEPDETMTVELSGPTGGAGIGTATATGTISDNDPLTLRVDDPSVPEGSSGTTSLVFTVTLVSRSLGVVTVDYRVDDGTATSGDYRAAPVAGTLRFDPGETAKTVRITVYGDEEPEGDETVVLTLSNPTGGAGFGLGAATLTLRGTGVIAADEVPLLSIGDAEAEEGDSGTTPLEFPVVLSEPAPAGGVSFTYEVAESGTATSTGAEADYTTIPPLTGTVAAGATTTTVRVGVVGDTRYEADETVVLRLLAVTSDDPATGRPNAAAAPGAGRTGTGTILDDDPVTVTFEVEGLSVAEDAAAEDSNFFRVTLDRVLEDAAIEVEFAVEGVTATAGADYDETRGSRNAGTASTNIAATGSYAYAGEAGGPSSTTLFRFPVIDDSRIEGDETLRFRIVSARTVPENDNVTIVRPREAVEATIVDDDEAVVSIDSPSRVEGAPNEERPLPFRVSLDRAAEVPVTFAYEVRAGRGARAGTDYRASPGTGRGEIPAGATTFDIDAVTILGDDEAEPGASETVLVVLSGLGGPAAFDGGGSTLTGTGSIRDDDSRPVLSIDSPGVDEGDAGPAELEFTVTLEPAATGTVTVDWATTGGGTAAAGADYTAAGDTLTFLAGERSKTFAVTVVGDNVDEDDETVEVELSNPSPGADIGEGTGTGSIRDDDLRPTLSMTAPVAVLEGGAGAATAVAFTVRLSAASGRDVEVFYEERGTATAGEDYTLSEASPLTIPAGATSAAIGVEVVGDDDFEGGETVSVTLLRAEGAGLPRGTLTRTLIITGDDTALASTLAVGDAPAVDEGDPAGTTELLFPVKLSPPAPAGGVTVEYRVAGGTATAGEDYAGATTSGTLTFVAGAILQLIRVEVSGDDEVEPDETVVVEIRNPSGAVIADGKARGTGMIRNDDKPLLSVEAPVVDEGAEELAFTVTLDAPAPTGGVTVEYRVVVASSTAEAGYIEYVSETLTIPAGRTSATIRVPVLRDDDEIVSQADRTVVVVFANPTNAKLDPADTATETTAEGRIRNDDLQVRIEGPDAASVDEGGTLTFKVALSDKDGNPAAAPVGGVAVDYRLAAAASDAVAADLAPAASSTGTVTVPGGRTERGFTVRVAADGVGERSERLAFELTNPRTGVLRGGTAGATIRNTDPVFIIDGPRSVPGAVEVGVELLPSSDRTREETIGIAVEVRIDGATSTSGMLVLPAGGATTTPRMGSLTFATSTTGVQKVAFEVEEGDVEFTFTAADPTGAQILRRDAPAGASAASTITTTPESPGSGAAAAKALANILAGVGRMIASNVVDLIWDRAEDHRSGVEGSYALVGGRSLGGGAFASGGGAEDGAALRLAGALAGLLGVDAGSPGSLLREAERRLARGGGLGALRDWADLPSGRDLMGRTRFAVSFDDGAEDGLADRLTVWGRGSITAFESGLEGGGFGAFSADGEVTAGHLGADYRLGEELLVGVAMGHTVGDVDYSFGGGADGEGAVETELTSVHPYLHWMSPSGLGVWGSVGYGTGSAEVKEKGEDAVKTDLSMEMAAVGVLGDLAYVGNIDLAVKADAFLIGTDADAVGDMLEAVSADASRVRLALEGSMERVLADGAVLAGRFELGARLDSGDAEEGAGADVAAGFGYAVPRLGLEVKGRGSLLLAHEESGFGEWGLGLGLTYDPGVRGRGVEFSIEPVWRVPARDAASSLWNADPGSLARPRGSTRGASLGARLGYGMGAWGDRALATVFGELDGIGGDRLRLGAELRQPDGGLGLELYGERLDRPAGAEHSVVLKGRLGF